MKSPLIIISLLISLHLFGQSFDPAFFPTFTPYSQDPILDYGDELFGSPWNDPTILKENGEYIMYLSGVEGGLNHPNDTLSIYRWLSDDGYDWTLNPTAPVLESIDGTYYGGGIETPSVVFYKGEYHMYNSVYTVNDPYQFKISHATSPDGLSWQIDSSVVLEPTSNLSWMDAIVAEPGIMTKEDTLYLFFTAASFTEGQSIGLVRSIDGSHFIDTTLTATLPTDVYQNGNDYVGLSTPSPVLIGDTIYLFTDVAQNVFGGNWMQVALHQFKSYGDINKWYADDTPIHTRGDFPWTNGNFSAEIRSITPLLDGNRLRIWYSGHNLSEIDTATNDTTYHAFFIGDELHMSPGHWGMGTSEYVFNSIVTSTNETTAIENNASIQFDGHTGFVKTKTTDIHLLKVHNLNGQLLLEKTFNDHANFQIDYNGIILINVIGNDTMLTEKRLSY